MDFRSASLRLSPLAPSAEKPTWKPKPPAATVKANPQEAGAFARLLNRFAQSQAPQAAHDSRG